MRVSNGMHVCDYLYSAFRELNKGAIKNILISHSMSFDKIIYATAIVRKSIRVSPEFTVQEHDRIE